MTGPPWISSAKCFPLRTRPAPARGTGGTIQIALAFRRIDARVAYAHSNQVGEEDPRTPPDRFGTGSAPDFAHACRLRTCSPWSQCGSRGRARRVRWDGRDCEYEKIDRHLEVRTALIRYGRWLRSTYGIPVRVPSPYPAHARSRRSAGNACPPRSSRHSIEERHLHIATVLIPRRVGRPAAIGHAAFIASLSRERCSRSAMAQLWRSVVRTRRCLQSALDAWNIRGESAAITPGLPSLRHLL